MNFVLGSDFVGIRGSLCREGFDGFDACDTRRDEIVQSICGENRTHVEKVYSARMAMDNVSP